MDSSLTHDCIVIGAGPAGVFAAINVKKKNPHASVLIIEKNSQPLCKLLLTGGGRCNVTNECFDPQILVQNYPRGSKELLGAFYRFQPRDMMKWLEERGVPLKVEAEGRVFPVSNSSRTVANCLIAELNKADVPIIFNQKILVLKKEESLFTLSSKENFFRCKNLIVATGSSKEGYEYARSLFHPVMNSVPSLFSFTLEASPLLDLSGVSFSNVELTIPENRLKQTGPLLVTHTGLSGPAVLKLSAWAARYCAEKNYQFPLEINWLPHLSPNEIASALLTLRTSSPKKFLSSENIFSLPKNFWNMCTSHLCHKRILDISNKEFRCIADTLHKDCYQVIKKSHIKEEFVMCGGVSLKGVDFQTMQSKLCKNLYFAGEILDIDGLTGGFNLQSAWTTGFIAGNSVNI